MTLVKKLNAKIDLHDAHAIRRELAQLYRDAREDRIPVEKATKLAYLLELLRKAYDSSMLQDRLAHLEGLLGQRRNLNEARETL